VSARQVKRRRWGLIVVVVALITAAVACSDSLQSRRVEPPPPIEPGPYSLWLNANRVSDREPADLVAVLVNHDGTREVFGIVATIDRWDGRSWRPHREMLMCLGHWHCIAESKRRGAIDSAPSVGLTATRESVGVAEWFTTKGLERGWYRISHTSNNGVLASAVFELAPDGASVAPIGPIDKPIISITPIVVAPHGSSVALTTLIPSYSSSHVDFELAAAGLTETARIQRWDGREWQPVGDVPLRAGRTWDRRADLPPLPEGAYRLARDGPNGEHTGLFWVDDLNA
jgi:hypothetical protein